MCILTLLLIHITYAYIYNLNMLYVTYICIRINVGRYSIAMPPRLQ